MFQRLIPEIESRLTRLSAPVALQLPEGNVVGPKDALVKLDFSSWTSLARLKAGEIGALGEEYVEGKLNIHGRMRDVMKVVSGMLPGSPIESDTGIPPIGLMLIYPSESMLMTMKPISSL